MLKKTYLILSRKLDLYSTKRLFEESLKLYQVQVLDPESSDLGHYTDNTKALIRIGDFRYHETIKHLSRFSLSYINSLSSFGLARHKGQCYQFLNSPQIPMPESLIINPKTPFVVDFPIVLKKMESLKGAGVFLAKNELEFEQILTSEFQNHNQVLIQKFYPECHGTDLRLLLVQDQVFAMQRLNHNGDFRSNLALGGIATKATATDEEIRIAKRALEKLKLNYAGFDFLRTKDGSLLLEANPSPGLKGIESVTNQNIAKHIVSL